MVRGQWSNSICCERKLTRLGEVQTQRARHCSFVSPPCAGRYSTKLIAPSFLGHIFEHIGRPKATGIMRFNVALAETAFVWLCQAMGIHPSFIESLNYLVGHFAVFTTYADDDKTAEYVRKSCLFHKPFTPLRSLRYHHQGSSCWSPRGSLLCPVQHTD